MMLGSQTNPDVPELLGSDPACLRDPKYFSCLPMNEEKELGF